MVASIFSKKTTFEVLFVASSQPLLTNPAFQGWIGIASLVVGIIGIIVSIFLGIYFFRIGRSLKLITYEILTDIPIISIPLRAKTGAIKVVYEDLADQQNVINNAKIVSLKVRNSGNQDIQIWHTGNTDIQNMEEPIEFEFTGRTVVCLTEVKTEPPDVVSRVELGKYLLNPSSTPDRLGLPPCLLKVHQTILLSAMLEGTGQSIKKYGKLFNGDIENNRDLEKRKQTLQEFVDLGLYRLVTAILSGPFPAYPCFYFSRDWTSNENGC